MEKSQRLLPYFFAVFAVLVIYCFWFTYFGHFPDFQGIKSTIEKKPLSITSVTHFHVTMLVLWLLMLIIQPILILKKQIKWHRILGKSSYLVVSLVFISFLLIINQDQTREKNLFVFTANLFDPVVFMVFYGLAIYYRKKTSYHSRFIIMSILPFLNPALARLGIGGVPIQLVFWALFFIIEAFNNKVFKPYLIGFGYYALNLGFVAYLAIANQPLLDKIWHIFF
jgi:hypothetical protein